MNLLTCAFILFWNGKYDIDLCTNIRHSVFYKRRRTKRVLYNFGAQHSVYFYTQDQLIICKHTTYRTLCPNDRVVKTKYFPYF